MSHSEKNTLCYIKKNWNLTQQWKTLNIYIECTEIWMNVTEFLSKNIEPGMDSELQHFNLILYVKNLQCWHVVLEVKRGGEQILIGRIQWGLSRKLEQIKFYSLSSMLIK